MIVDTSFYLHIFNMGKLGVMQTSEEIIRLIKPLLILTAYLLVGYYFLVA
jgi:hypothetical protein